MNYGKPPRLKNISSQHRVFHVRYADSGSGLTLPVTQTLKSEEMEDEEEDIEDRNEIDRSHAPATPTSLVAELPLSHQIFNWIDSFGPSGVTSVVRSHMPLQLPVSHCLASSPCDALTPGIPQGRPSDQLPLAIHVQEALCHHAIVCHHYVRPCCDQDY